MIVAEYRLLDLKERGGGEEGTGTRQDQLFGMPTKRGIEMVTQTANV